MSLRKEMGTYFITRSKRKAVYTVCGEKETNVTWYCCRSIVTAQIYPNVQKDLQFIQGPFFLKNLKSVFKWWALLFHAHPLAFAAANVLGAPGGFWLRYLFASLCIWWVPKMGVPQHG